MFTSSGEATGQSSFIVEMPDEFLLPSRESVKDHGVPSFTLIKGNGGYYLVEWVVYIL